MPIQRSMNTRAGSRNMVKVAVVSDQDDEHRPQASTVLDDRGYDTERIPSPEMEAILHRIRQGHRETAQLEVHPACLEDEKQPLSTQHPLGVSPIASR